MKSDINWHTVCSALDVLGDTCLAIESYGSSIKIESEGARYLLVYGIFQVLQTQQDAVRNLCRAMDLETQESPKISRITSLRSDSVAHPTYGKENGRRKVGFIQRISLSPSGFTLVTLRGGDGSEGLEDLVKFEYVDVLELIQLQTDSLHKVLTEVIQVLDDRENQFRKMFHKEKLAEAFPDTLSYYFEKIVEASSDLSRHEIGKIHLALVRERLELFRAQLEKQGLWGGYNGVAWAYESIEHPLRELVSYFENRSASRLIPQDVPIFVSFLRGVIDNLISMATEIDNENSPSD